MNTIEQRWDFHSNESILGIEIGDLNNNGHNEILGFTNSGKLLILSLTGKKINELEITENSSLWQVKIFDIDHDDKNEVVLAGLDGLLRTFKCSKSYELTPLWSHQFGTSISGFLQADVNFDGTKEIIAYSIDKSIRCLNSIDGSLIWGQLFEEGIGDAIIWQDLDNPLALEIIACGNDGTIRSFKGKTGELNWFKRFNNKVRCVSYIKRGNEILIACGGDDKKFHLFNKNTHEDLKTLQFEDIVWKCSSFLHDGKLFLLVSTYSFDYFDDNIKIENYEFTSQFICLNSDFEKIWEIKNVNVETYIPIEVFTKKYIIVGTTKGNILIIESGSGNILVKIDKKSCVNDLKYDSELELLISCHDNGSIFAYFLGDS
ncbi:MAG: WD40 repeat domain-containing protein [Candidatus Lokiarchaeota archaeon]|nr:WD40 repeat domain-containing protein [Candidatus Lokiarchaeota archaeon]